MSEWTEPEYCPRCTEPTSLCCCDTAMSDLIRRLRNERSGWHLEDRLEAADKIDALAVQIERLRGLLMDIPWHVVEAAAVDDSIAKWFRRRDDLLFGGAAEDKP